MTILQSCVNAESYCEVEKLGDGIQKEGWCMSQCTKFFKSLCFLNLKDNSGTVLYEEISLHLLDKPNRGKLTHCVKMEQKGEK